MSATLEYLEDRILLKEATQLLLEQEWATMEGEEGSLPERCMWCTGKAIDGHGPDCALIKFLIKSGVR